MALVLGVMLLAGCASQWRYPEGMTREEAQAINNNCTRSSLIGYNAYSAPLYNMDLYNSCMEARGLQKAQ
jgi:hypothetical protein